METLKTLEINGITLQYEVVNSSDGSNNTEFYLGTTSRKYKKYGFFGKEMTEVNPNYVFTIWKDIEYHGYTKKQVRGWIEYELSLLNRKEEIKKGEII